VECNKVEPHFLDNLVVSDEMDIYDIKMRHDAGVEPSDTSGDEEQPSSDDNAPDAYAIKCQIIFPGVEVKPVLVDNGDLCTVVVP